MLRSWESWVAIISPTCELDKQDPRDSRLLVAPVAFRSLWAGSQWDQIGIGGALQYAYLPPVEDEEQLRVGAKGWPTATEGAVVFGSSNLISRSLAGVPRFGMTPEMRSYFQQRIVLWASVRDWKRAAQHDQLVGKTIRAIDDTGERHPEGGVLFKLALGDGQDDEVTLGIVLRPPAS